MRQIRQCIRISMAGRMLFLLITFVGLATAQSALAQNMSYTIQYDATLNRATVTSSHYGQWISEPYGRSPDQTGGVDTRALRLISTAPGTLQPPGTSRHVVQFDFMSPNYFGASGGHFALFARADLYTQTLDEYYPYRGHGVILGDASGYPNHVHINNYWCTRTPARNQITIEVAGSAKNSPLPNCVFGQETYGNPALSNNAWYRVRLVSEYINGSYRTSYVLYLPTFVGWLPYVERTKTYSYPQLPSNLGGWFFTEVFNRSSNWTLYISNLNAWWE